MDHPSSLRLILKTFCMLTYFPLPVAQDCALPSTMFITYMTYAQNKHCLALWRTFLSTIIQMLIYIHSPVARDCAPTPLPPTMCVFCIIAQFLSNSYVYCLFEVCGDWQFAQQR